MKAGADGEYVAVVPEGGASASIPSQSLVVPDGSDERTFVVVGGGGAGQFCAESLRKEGFKGKIVMLSKEQLLPYDRCALSKTLKPDPSKTPIRK